MRAFELGEDVLRRLFVLDVKFALLYAVIEAGGLDRLRFDFVEPRVERRRQLGGKVGDDRPVFGFDEGLNLALALDDQADRDRLSASCRKPPPAFVPQERAVSA